MNSRTKLSVYNGCMNTMIHITAFWDDGAKVWVAESDNFKGLITEASSIDALHAKLQRLIPELAELNYPELKGELVFQLTLQGVAPVSA